MPYVEIEFEASSFEEAEKKAKEIMEKYEGQYVGYNLGPAWDESGRRKEGYYELRLLTYTPKEAKTLLNDIQTDIEAQMEAQAEMQAKERARAQEVAFKQALLAYSLKHGTIVSDAGFAKPSLGDIAIVRAEYEKQLAEQEEKREQVWKQALLGASMEHGVDVSEAGFAKPSQKEVATMRVDYLKQFEETGKEVNDVYKGYEEYYKEGKLPSISPQARGRIHGVTPLSMEEGQELARKWYENIKENENKIVTLSGAVYEKLGLENEPYVGSPTDRWARFKWAVKETMIDVSQGFIGFFTFPVDITLLAMQKEKLKGVSWEAVKEGLWQSIKTGELGAEITGGLLAGGFVSALRGVAMSGARGVTKGLNDALKGGVDDISTRLASSTDDLAKKSISLSDDLAKRTTQVGDDFVNRATQFRRTLFTEEDVAWFKKRTPDTWFTLYKTKSEVPQKTQLTQLSVYMEREFLKSPKFVVPKKPSYVWFKKRGVEIIGDETKLHISVGDVKGTIWTTKNEFMVEGKLWEHPELVKKALQTIAVEDAEQWARLRRAMLYMSARAKNTFRGKGLMWGAKAKVIMKEVPKEEPVKVIDLTKASFRKMGPVYLSAPVDTQSTYATLRAINEFMSQSSSLVPPALLPESVQRNLEKGMSIRSDITNEINQKQANIIIPSTQVRWINRQASIAPPKLNVKPIIIEVPRFKQRQFEVQAQNIEARLSQRMAATPKLGFRTVDTIGVLTTPTLAITTLPMLRAKGFLKTTTKPKPFSSSSVKSSWPRRRSSQWGKWLKRYEIFRFEVKDIDKKLAQFAKGGGFKL